MSDLSMLINGLKVSADTRSTPVPMHAVHC